MFFDEKKKGGLGSAILMGHMTPDGAKDTYEEDPDEDLHAVSDDLLAAVEAKDRKGVTEALKAFMAMIESRDEEQDQGEG